MLKTRDRHREIYHKERERVDGGKRERAQKCLESKKERKKESFRVLWSFCTCGYTEM
jgi:hypothetical protein